MSVLIKGMEMPTGCSAVTLKVWPDNQVEIFDADGEWKTSEAIPVPPHGRLIDADALGSFPYNMDFCDGGEADEWIQNAPTIIEAEEKGT